MRPLSEFPLRHSKAVLLITGLLTLAALFSIPHLRLDTDVLALFPRESELARDYRLYLDAFDGKDQLWIVLEDPSRSGDSESLMDAADELKYLLEESGQFRSVRCDVTEQDFQFYTDWVLGNLLYLIPDSEWEGVEVRLEPEAIESAIHTQRQQVDSPQWAILKKVFPHDPLGLAEFLPLSLSDLQGGQYVSLEEGYFFSQDGQSLLMMLIPEESSFESHAAKLTVQTIRDAQAKVLEDFEFSKGTLAFRNTGGAFFAVEDEATIRSDLVRTAVFSIAGVLLLLLLMFGGLGVFVLSVPTMGVALVVTAGIVAWFPGRLTVLSVGFGAIMIGLGIDYTIHFYNAFRNARFTESVEDSVRMSLRDSGPGILGGAVTTAIAFGVLAGSREASLAEFGSILALSTLVFLGSSLLFLPAFTLCLGRVFPVLFRLKKKPPWLWRTLSAFLRRTVYTSVKHPGKVLAAGVAVTALLGMFAMRTTVTMDLMALRSTNSRAMENEKYVQQTFGGYSDVHVFFAESSQSDDLVSKIGFLDKHIRKQFAGEDAAVDSFARWSPSSDFQAKRRKQILNLPLEKIQNSLTESLEREGFDSLAFEDYLSRLNVSFQKSRPGMSLDAMEALAPEGLAANLSARKNGRFYGAVTVSAPRNMNPELVQSAFTSAQEIPGLKPHLASLPLLVREFRDRAMGELRWLLGVAAAAVFFFVWWLTRSLSAGLLSLMPVAGGMVWTLGFIQGAGFPLDITSALFIPMLIGIGIDDGIHIVMHGLRHPDGDIAENTLLPGRGILLTSLTTALGFSALLGAHLRALHGIALLGIAGIMACSVISITMLPACLSLMKNSSFNLRKFLIQGLFWRKFHRWGARNIPDIFEPPIVWILAFFFYCSLPAVRKNISANLSHILKNQGIWSLQPKVFRVIHNYAKCLTDSMRVMEGGRVVEFKSEEDEAFKSLESSGRGAVFLGAHIGHWEISSRNLMENTSRSLHILRAQEPDPRTQAYESTERHSSHQGRIITHYTDRPGFMGLDLLKALRRGDYAAILGDRLPPDSRFLEKNFFGSPARFPIGPVIFAAMAGVPLVPVFAYRTGVRQCRLVTGKPIEISREAKGGEALSQAMDHVVSALEEAIGEDPCQWFCFQKFWPDD